ncbi:MAG: sodium-dependent bicarbonate transport family permease [Sphingomonadales bacterium]|nr:sodium-dependent bicarbonate transport family permease [Sphingomonadales bacterium]
MSADLLTLALDNLTSPVILFFLLGLSAALLRSDLSVPEAVGKALALYLMLAIGFKGGAELNKHGLDSHVASALAAGFLLSLLIPVIAFGLLRLATRTGHVDAAAIAAHYGSVSVVTFVTGTQFLDRLGIGYEGYMVAVVAIMETPAILSGLLIAKFAGNGGAPTGRGFGVQKKLVREVFLNGSVVLLMGAFVIGWITGEAGMARMSPFVGNIFQGVLALFLLEMGLVAGTRLRGGTGLEPRLLVFGLVMPLIGAGFGLAAGLFTGLSLGGTMLLILLAASASYIAVPAAMRLALPAANPGISLALSLAVTFPFNIIVGMPLYLAAARLIAGP